jgi:hypothetical protein
MRKLPLLFCFLASFCFGQSADDNIVVVGNQAQPVQWTHQNSIQNALLKAGPYGVIWIPPNYKGTDCNPISSCSPSTALVIDLRGGVFQTYPPLSGLGSPVAGPFIVTGPSFIGLTQDLFCAFNLGYAADTLCDLLGQLVFTPGGTGTPQILAFSNVVQTWLAQQNFSTITVSGTCTGCVGVYEAGVLTNDSPYTNTQVLTAGAATHTFANGFSYTSASTFGCICTDQTAANACKAVPASANTVTLAGTGTDTLWLSCSGH